MVNCPSIPTPFILPRRAVLYVHPTSCRSYHFRSSEGKPATLFSFFEKYLLVTIPADCLNAFIENHNAVDLISLFAFPDLLFDDPIQDNR